MTVALATLLVDGVDIKSLSGMVVNDMELFAPGTRRGSNDTIPGVRGQTGAELPLDAYSFSVMVTVLGATQWETVANLRAVGTALAGTNGLVALTRRLPTGASTHVDHTAAGQFVGGLGFALLNLFTGQTELQFLNLDGAWWTGSAWVTP